MALDPNLYTYMTDERVGWAGLGQSPCLAGRRAFTFRRMEPLPSELGRIAQHYDLQDIYVFGSRASEIAARVRLGVTPGISGSDVDIAVQPRRGRSLDAHERVRIAIEFENLFDASRVDLVILSEARPSLAVDVIRGELLYTADPRAQAEHELYVLRRAADLAPLQRERERLVLERGGR